MWAVVFCAILGLISGCGSGSDENTPAGEAPVAVYHRITAGQAKEMMDEGNPYVLLDVRTDAEFAEKRIDGAILIPDYEIADRAADELPDREILILIYCRSGNRSATAARKMIAMGYTNVYDFGGIIDWPYDTVKD